MSAVLDLTLLAVLAVGPPFLFALWIRARERYNREPFALILGRFVYGATLGVAIALALSYLFDVGLNAPAGGFGFSELFFATVFIAPIVEEVAKALGLSAGARSLDEPEDGIIQGAAIGLGFAATENFVYGMASLYQEGMQMAIAVMGARIISSTLLHAASTALIGYGYSIALHRGGVALYVVPLYFIAVLLHGTYNFLVFTQGTLGFLAAIVMVTLILAFLHREIYRLDRRPQRVFGTPLGAGGVAPAPTPGFAPSPAASGFAPAFAPAPMASGAPLGPLRPFVAAAAVVATGPPMPAASGGRRPVHLAGPVSIGAGTPGHPMAAGTTAPGGVATPESGAAAARQPRRFTATTRPARPAAARAPASTKRPARSLQRLGAGKPARAVRPARRPAATAARRPDAGRRRERE